MQRLLASTLNQEVQQLVEGISVRQLQNAIVKPQSIAREYFTMLVGGQQVPEE